MFFCGGIFLLPGSFSSSKTPSPGLIKQKRGRKVSHKTVVCLLLTFENNKVHLTSSMSEEQRAAR